MATVTVKFELNIPDVDATDEQIRDWVRFELGEIGGLSEDNPLCDHEVEAEFGTVDIQ